MTIGSTSAISASSSLAVLQQDPNTSREQQLRDAATAFESIFLQQVFSEMRKSAQMLGGSNDMGGQFYDSMLDQAVAESAAENDGFGIRDVLLRSWGLEPENNRQRAARQYAERASELDGSSIAMPSAEALPLSTRPSPAAATDSLPRSPLPAIAGPSAAQAAVALPSSSTDALGQWNAPVSAEAAQPEGYDPTRELRGTRLFTAPEQQVQTSAGGRVTGVFYEAAHGPSVEVEHEGGWVTRYGGLEGVRVNVGDRVEAGDTLGRVSGENDAPYVHFEVRRGNIQFSPRAVVPALQVTDE